MTIRSAVWLLAFAAPGTLAGQQAPPANEDMELTGVRVRYLEDLDLLVFEQDVRGAAGGTLASGVGSLDGAPVLGHVFPTTLEPLHVGFTRGEGIVALAVTSHPDFDDTPLWDENGDGDYGNDGVRFHTHWVLLGPDDRVPGGLAVQEIRKEDLAEVLPPTNPGLPMYMDSPGFSVLARGKTLRVVVPVARVGGARDFSYDGVTAYMEVNTSDANRPMLGVYEVYSIVSGDLSLPFRVETASNH